MNGVTDMLKSERGIMNLLFLAVLAVLLFTRADKSAVDTWAMYAGGATGLYTLAKSWAPGPRATKPEHDPDPGEGA